MNRWQAVSNYKVNKYYDKFNKTAFHDFIAVNGFHKVKDGVPYNAKGFLESGIDRYKEMTFEDYLSELSEEDFLSLIDNTTLPEETGITMMQACFFQ